MKKCILPFIATLLGLISPLLAIESGNCRLLSISESEKLILVSQIPNKTKYLLDATSAKITVNGKPAEFKQLRAFSIVQVIMDIRKSIKNGVTLNGSAREIRILDPEIPPKDN
jgi:hypothetical protein